MDIDQILMDAMTTPATRPDLDDVGILRAKLGILELELGECYARMAWLEDCLANAFEGVTVENSR